MLRGKRVLVVVPAYNEERLVGRTLRGIPDFGWATRLATGTAIRDSQCGYTAITLQAQLVVDWDRLWSRMRRGAIDRSRWRPT